nr:methylenetetrahydrofolate reductase 1 [Tanacetum cinerariifolium]
MVEKEWKETMEGHHMFKVVKKLKMLMYQLRRLAWKNVVCKIELRSAEIRFLGFDNKCEDLDVTSLFQKKINIDDANNMIMEITKYEIREEIFDIEDNKAPGIDGYTSTFFKKS